MENHHHGTSDRLAASQQGRHQFCLDHLNKIYCIYSHLAERLSELTGNQQFEDFSLLTGSLIGRSAGQLELLEHIYDLIGEQPDIQQCAGLAQVLEDNFSHIQLLPTPGGVLLKSFMLSYLQYSNSILLASFQLVQRGAETVFSTQVCLLISALFVLAEKENAIVTSFP